MRKIPTVRRTHCHKSKIPLRGVEFADAQKAAVGIDGWSVKRSSNRFFQGSSLKKESGESLLQTWRGFRLAAT